MKPVDLHKLLDVGVAMSRETDTDKLLYTILTAAMDITGCDAGTLYGNTGEALEFKFMLTRSQGVDRRGEEIGLPPVPLSAGNVCAYAALQKAVVNIPDVYESTDFDFSGPRRYDDLTGYRTRSMLVVPMQDDYGDVIGVLQLLNAMDETGEVVPFDAAYEPVVLSLASQCAILLTNRNYAAEVANLLHSFVRVMSTAIDARSPYNANHTKNMAHCAGAFLDWLEETGSEWRLSGPAREAFLMSVWLHDIGKLVIPLEVMDKQSRLGAGLARVEHRFETALLHNHVAFLRGGKDEAAFDREQAQLNEAWELVQQADGAGFLPEETVAQIRQTAALCFTNSQGEAVPYLTPEETECLCVQRGTLTPAERRLMESHVEMTAKMLSEMAFSRSYRDVPAIAASHHEFLNGRGYPDGLSGEDIPKEARLLTILDIFDALTARDRPYKPAMPVEKAFGILEDMAANGQLDGEILALFRASHAWEAPAGVNSTQADEP